MELFLFSSEDRLKKIVMFILKKTIFTAMRTHCAMKLTPTLKASVTKILAESQNGLRANNELAPIMLDSVLPD